MDYTNVEDLMNKLGIRNEKIKSGVHKDILSMYRPMTEDEKQMIQSMVDDIYNQFIQTVADGRKMDENKVRKIADGRILTGKQAQDLGLVDAMGNYYDALSYAASSGGIQNDVDHIPVQNYDNGFSWQEILSSRMDAVSVSFASSLADHFREALLGSSEPAIK